MLKRDDIMLIKGCIAFDSKKQKLAAWKELKSEFGESVKILFHDQFLTYSATVDRNLYF